MFESPHRPVVRLAEDGSRSFFEPGRLQARVTLTLAVYTDQARAELLAWAPDDPPGGHLAWEYHIGLAVPLKASVRNAASMLGNTSEWLVKSGWPGLPL